MQQSYVYLYRNQIDVFTNSTTSWTSERYRRVYNRNLKIYRGVDNTVDFQVRNADEKATAVSNSMVFNLVNREGGDLLLQKDCTAVDATIGRFQVVLSDAELRDIEPGSYNYSLVIERRSTEGTDSTEYIVQSRTPLYIDSQYGTTSTVEIYNDVYGEFIPSIEVDKFNRINPFAVGEEDPEFYISSIIDANPLTHTASSQHTFQVFPTNYTGEIIVQGSLSDGGNPEVWSDIDITNITESSEPFFVNVTGKYNFFRVKHTATNTGANATFVIAQTILGAYTVTVREDGFGYNVGDVIIISGAELGGETPTNDLTITVASLKDNDLGQIDTITWTGNSYPGVRTFVKSGEAVSVGTIDKILYR